MADNQRLSNAKNAKQDEFYTRLVDIEDELKHYKHHFKNKTVLCNCDDPRVSNFFHYFSYNFEALGLKRLITTCYKNQQRDLFSQHNVDKAIWLEYTGDRNGNRIPDPDEIGIRHFNGDGDFRSAECIELLKQADIVVTNPPFSLFREYVAQLMEYKKKFVIMGNKNAITYKEFFPLLMNNQVWVGVRPINRDFWLYVPDDEAYEKIDEEGRHIKHIMACWFTNLDIQKRHEDLDLYKRYNPEEFPKYDNYNAINVDKVTDIPLDYAGMMGVPITFMDKYNPDQFEIIHADTIRKNKSIPEKKHGLIKDKESSINGKPTYVRIVIRNKHPEKPKKKRG
jgi:hypothetical protein